MASGRKTARGFSVGYNERIFSRFSNALWINV